VRVIALIDYGLSNLRSVQKALLKVGAEVRITRRPEAAVGTLAEGKTEMMLGYALPWERTEPPAQTTNYMVIMGAGKNRGKQ
jgi:hypothetical protein